MDRALILLAVLTATAVFSAWWTSRDGRVTSLTDRLPASTAGRSVAATATVSGEDPRWAGLPVEAADVAAAVTPTTILTLVEFTAPNCQPCEATRLLLDQAVAGRDDVSVVSLDVGDALDLARAHRIMRAPTTLLITNAGHLLGRVGGIPRPAELAALLDSTRERQPA